RLPVTQGRGAAMWQRRQLLLDLRQSEAEPLGDQDEADPADIGSYEAPLIAGSARGRDQAPVLVETDRRNRDAGAARQFADGDELGLGHVVLPRLIHSQAVST